MERSDSKLKRLTQEQREQLIEQMMHGGMSQLELRDWVKKEFGISCGVTALCNFHSRHVQPRYLARITESARVAEKTGRAMEDASAFDAATIAGVKQMVFETISSGGDSGTVSRLMRLFLELRNQEIKTRQLDLDREKFEKDFTVAAMEHADTIKQIKTDSALDSDAKIAAVRKVLFGVGS